jgi:hypothetical protein
MAACAPAPAAGGPVRGRPPRGPSARRHQPHHQPSLPGTRPSKEGSPAERRARRVRMSRPRWAAPRQGAGPRPVQRRSHSGSARSAGPGAIRDHAATRPDRRLTDGVAARFAKARGHLKASDPLMTGRLVADDRSFSHRPARSGVADPSAREALPFLPCAATSRRISQADRGVNDNS